METVYFTFNLNHFDGSLFQPNGSHMIFSSFSLHNEPSPRSYYSTGLETRLTLCVRLHCLLSQVLLMLERFPQRVEK